MACILIQCAAGLASKSPTKIARLSSTVLRPSSDEDHVIVLSDSPQKAVLQVNLKRGINGANLHFQEGYKPKTLEVQFKGFTNLESFSIQNEKSNFSTSLKIAPLTREVPNGSNLEKESKLKISIEYQEPRKLIIVRAPCSKILANTPFCKLFWIDAYRQ